MYDENIFNLLNRKKELFLEDLSHFDEFICGEVKENTFLIIGGGGSIGQAITKELFKRKARAIHVVDLNENYLAELVRDIRSSMGYLVDKFETFPIDCGASYFDGFMAKGRYDYILNLSAMKHVRSEHDAFSMKRMIDTNIFNVLSTYESAKKFGAKKYFCVSTDKAANPANFMGATKRAMELFLMRNDNKLPVSGARFANVAFSNGSLLDGFTTRLAKCQPFSLPHDIKRFFLTPQEAGVICLFSTILSGHQEILFPHKNDELVLTKFLDIAENYLKSKGKKAVLCKSEDEARELMKTINLDMYWPIHIFETNTSGEKPFEEFYTDQEEIFFGKFCELASVKFSSEHSADDYANFCSLINSIDLCGADARTKLLNALKSIVNTFEHVETNKFLNGRM